MADIPSDPVKKTVRTKKTTAPSDGSTGSDLATQTISLITDLELQIGHLTELKNDVERLERGIEQIKQEWSKEQKAHDQELAQRNQADETLRRRDQETYDYDTKLAKKRTEDELADKKARLEKDLADRGQEIEQDKKQLSELQKLVESFTVEKDKAVKEAVTLAQKELSEKFETEKKLRDQETKSEKEILTLKISSMDQETSRQSKEIEILKKSLEEATRQLKDIAVQVIQSNRPETSSNTSTA